MIMMSGGKSCVCNQCKRQSQMKSYNPGGKLYLQKQDWKSNLGLKFSEPPCNHSQTIKAGKRVGQEIYIKAIVSSCH